MSINSIIHKNLPNILTVARILSIPLIIYFFFSAEPIYKIVSFILVFIFSLTDFFDGYYARTYNLVTGLGKYLDPLADKIFILSLFFSLHLYFNSFFPLWMIFIIIFRDIGVMMLRNIYYTNNLNFNTSILGKRKTLIQIIAIHIMLLLIIMNEYKLLSINFFFVYYLMLICVIITLYSGLDYLFKYYKFKKNNE